MWQPTLPGCASAALRNAASSSGAPEPSTASWLPLATPQGALATTYAVVDRGVYLELSAPAETGPGPLQAVSDAVVDALPPQQVRVR